MPDKSKTSDQTNNRPNHLDRRNLLLAGSALVAASAVGSGALIQTAQAQQLVRQTSWSSGATTSAPGTSATTAAA